MKNEDSYVDFEKLGALVIDDSDFVRDIVTRILKGFGIHNIYGAEDGVSGLMKLEEKKNNIDFILCDLSMDQMNGFEFVKSLRAMKDSKLKSLPVIILTVHGEGHYVDEAVRYGIDGYVVKPVSPNVLKMRIEMALENQKSQ